MVRKRLIAVVALAATTALVAGCNLPANLAKVKDQLLSQGKALMADTLATVQSETDLDVAAMLSGDSSYAVQALSDLKDLKDNLPGTITRPDGGKVEFKPGEIAITGPDGKPVTVKRGTDGGVEVTRDGKTTSVKKGSDGGMVVTKDGVPTTIKPGENGGVVVKKGDGKEISVTRSSDGNDVLVSKDGKDTQIRKVGTGKVVVTGPDGKQTSVEKSGDEVTVMRDGKEVKVTRGAAGIKVKGSDGKEIDIPAKPRKEFDKMPKLQGDAVKKALETAEKFEARAKVKEKLADIKKNVEGDVSRVVVPNEDGSETVYVKATIKTKNGTFTHNHARTLDASGALLEDTFSAERVYNSGMKATITRNVDVAENGTRTETFTKTLTRKDGKTKTISWIRTIQPDGASDATGTISRFDGSTVTITVKKTADGKETVISKDDKSKVEVTVTKDDETPTKADAKAVSLEDGSTLEEQKGADIETAEPTEN